MHASHSSAIDGVQSSIEGTVIGLQSFSCPSIASFGDDCLDVSETIRHRQRNFQLPPPTYHDFVDLSHEVLNIPEVCCGEQCLLEFSPKEIWSLHSLFFNSSEVDQKQYLVSSFTNQATRKRVIYHLPAAIRKTYGVKHLSEWDNTQLLQWFYW